VHDAAPAADDRDRLLDLRPLLLGEVVQVRLDAAYRIYYQETAPPYRRAEPATVYRFGTLGIVIGRWTS
jgi:hypothetical protein